MRIRGERVVALVGLFFAATSMMLLGVVGNVANVVDPVNPIRLTDAVGLDLSERLRTAALLAIPLAFGVSLTATSVQTYINRRVPIAFQGRTFAMQGWLRNGSAIVPLLALGALATEFGVENVLLFSPLALLAVGYSLVFLSFGISSLKPPAQLGVMETFWYEPRESEETA